MWISNYSLMLNNPANLGHFHGDIDLLYKKHKLTGIKWLRRSFCQHRQDTGNMPQLDCKLLGALTVFYCVFVQCLAGQGPNLSCVL